MIIPAPGNPHTERIPVIFGKIAFLLQTECYRTVAHMEEVGAMYDDRLVEPLTTYHPSNRLVHTVTRLPFLYNFKSRCCSQNSVYCSVVDACSTF
jgi:hypothetical protein